MGLQVAIRSAVPPVRLGDDHAFAVGTFLGSTVRLCCTSSGNTRTWSVRLGTTAGLLQVPALAPLARVRQRDTTPTKPSTPPTLRRDVLAGVAATT